MRGFKQRVLRIAGHQQHLHLRGPSSHAFDDDGPGRARHNQIGDEQIWWLEQVTERKPLFAGAAGVHVITTALERMAKQIAHGRLVFDEQNPRLGCGVTHHQFRELSTSV